MDGISELPEHILHHILCFLPQAKAVQTSLLSKSWRYLWCTRPIFQFSQFDFRGSKQTYLSVLDTALQRYYDQKLCIHEFVVDMWEADSQSIPFLEKWIPIVLHPNTAVNKFHLSLMLTKTCFDLPSTFFKVESLKDLCLKRCQINTLIHDNYVILSKHLQTLSLTEVYIEDETFEKIMSSCPSIEYVTLNRCKGLKKIKVHLNAADYNLKHFNFNTMDDDNSIDFDVPRIETITIGFCSTSCFDNNINYFPNLTCLRLISVRINSKSFNILSCNFPNLQDLTVAYCRGFQEFHLSSHSIKSVRICAVEPIKKATFDVSNIVRFEYIGYIPLSISFTKINNNSHRERKSYIQVWTQVDISWFLNLHAILNALSQSEIYLHLCHEFVWTGLPGTSPSDGNFYNPVQVELFELTLYGGSLTRRYSDCMNNVFRIFRPRIISGEWYPTQTSKWKSEYELSRFQCEILEMERKGKHYAWQQDLEDVSMETFDKNANEWNHHVQWKGLSEYELRSVKYSQLVRVRLKWRDHF